MARKMTDLHCHILPGIDDGARNLECSLALLREEKKQGVDSIVFTPHFDIERISVDDFVAARDNAYRQLLDSDEFVDLNISTKLAAEVYFSVAFDKIDLEPLCYNGTNYILIELPFRFKPHGLMYSIDNVINRGYTPIIAHVERYDYIMKDPTLLYDLVSKGCVAQINAETMVHGVTKKSMAIKFIKWGLVRFLCTDSHSVDRRPPNLEQGYQVIEKMLGKDCVNAMLEDARSVFHGEQIDLYDIKKPKSFFGSWI